MSSHDKDTEEHDALHELAHNETLGKLIYYFDDPGCRVVALIDALGEALRDITDADDRGHFLAEIQRLVIDHVVSDYALMAPAGTPKPIVQRLHQETAKALSDSTVRDQLMAQGLTPRGASPEELATALSQQLARYEALFRQAGIRAD